MNLGTLTAILAIVDKVSPAISGISGNVGKAMSTIKTAVAGAFAVDVIAKAIGKFTEFTGRVTDTAAKLGISTTAVQKFELAFKDAGVGIDTVGNAIGEMGRRLVEGDSGAVNALGQLGLKTADLVRMAPDAAFTKIADAVAGIQNPMERATAAQQIFGKGGKEVLAGLDGKLGETTQKFEDMGLVMSADVVAAGDALGDSLGQLESAGMNLLGVVLVPILPLLTSLAQYLAETANVAAVVARWFGTELMGAFSRAKEALFSFLSGLAETASKVPLLGSAMKGIGDAAGWLKDKAVEAGHAIAETYAGMRQEVAEKSAPALERTAAVLGVYGENAKAVKEKTDAATKAQKEFNDSLSFVQVATGGYLALPAAVEPATDAIDEVRESMRAVEEITVNTNWVGYAKGMTDAKASAKGLGDTLKNNLLGVLQSIPSTLASALQGGGGIMGAIKSIGTQVGSALGGAAGFAIGGPMGQAIGSAVGSFAGPLLGKIGSIFGKSTGKEANNLRDQIVAASGGIQQLAQRAQEAGTSVDALLRARNPKDVQAAWDALNGKISIHQQQIQLAKQAMEEFGIDASQAGAAFKQAEMDETARSITEKLEAMMAVGVSTDAIIAGAGDEIGAFIQRSIEMGTSVPKEWEPIVKKMMEAGTLVDANGNKLTEMSDVPFAETLNDKISMVMDKLSAFIDRIMDVPDALARIPRDVDVNFNGHYNTEDPPGFANGSAGIRDFGKGTFAILHGRERIQTEAQMRAEQSYGGGGGMPSVSIDARGALLGDYASQQRLAAMVSEAVIGQVALRRRLGMAGGL